MDMQLLIPITPIIFFSPYKGPPFEFSRSNFFCGTLYTSLNEKCDTSLESSSKLSPHIQYPEGSEKFGVFWATLLGALDEKELFPDK